MPVARQLVIELVGKADKYVKSLDDADKASKSFGDKVEGAGKKMTAFTSVPIAGFLAVATKAAIEDEAAQEKLKKTLENTIGASKGLTDQVEGYITKAQKASTFTDDELRPAFEALVRETRDVTKSNQLMTVAMDLATAKSIPLETATKALIDASNGRTRSLADLGIQLKENVVDQDKVADLTDKVRLAQINAKEATDKYGASSSQASEANIKLEAAQRKLTGAQQGGKEVAMSFDGIMQQVSATVGGQAAAATETAAGKMAILKRDVGEASEKIGAALIPAVTQLAGFLTGSLLPALDNVSGGNGAMVLMGVAAAGPVLTNMMKLKNAIVGLNLTLDATAVKAAAALGALGLVIEGIGVIKRDMKEGGFFQGILGPSPLSRKLDDLNPFGRAAGGPVTGGRPYVVGEKGPELFVPSSSGQIVPNGRSVMGSAAATVTVNVYGSVLTENQLVEVVRNGLLQKQRSTPLGFVS